MFLTETTKRSYIQWNLFQEMFWNIHSLVENILNSRGILLTFVYAGELATSHDSQVWGLAGVKIISLQ